MQIYEAAASAPNHLGCPAHLEQIYEPRRVKVGVASVMQPTLEYRYPSNASL